MEIRRFKTHAAVGPSTWETGTTLQFVASIPEICWCLRVYGLLPPLAVLNELFAIGIDEAGMSGGCEWRPFEMTAEEYSSLEEELLTSPEYTVTVDEDLRSCQSLAEWRDRARQKYAPVFPQQRKRPVGSATFIVREGKNSKE